MAVCQVSIQLSRQVAGYTVQTDGHRLECSVEGMALCWRCSCGFQSRGDGFDLLHLALKLYAEQDELNLERQRLRDAIETFLRRRSSYADLRAAVAGLSPAGTITT